MSDAIKNFVENLFDQSGASPAEKATTDWIEKIASTGKPTTEDKKMGDLRAQLEQLDIDELYALGKELTEEKVAGVDDMTEEQAIEILANTPADQFLDAMFGAPDEKVAEEDDMGLSEISALDLLSEEGLIEELLGESEKVAEEDGEDVPEHIQMGYETGAAQAYGLYDTLQGINDTIEKTAEADDDEITREDLIDYLEEELEKDAEVEEDEVTREDLIDYLEELSISEELEKGASEESLEDIRPLLESLDDEDLVKIAVSMSNIEELARMGASGKKADLKALLAMGANRSDVAAAGARGARNRVRSAYNSNSAVQAVREARAQHRFFRKGKGGVRQPLGRAASIKETAKIMGKEYPTTAGIGMGLGAAGAAGGAALGARALAKALAARRAARGSVKGRSIAAFRALQGTARKGVRKNMLGMSRNKKDMARILAAKGLYYGGAPAAAIGLGGAAAYSRRNK